MLSYKLLLLVVLTNGQHQLWCNTNADYRAAGGENFSRITMGVYSYTSTACGSMVWTSGFQTGAIGSLREEF